MTEWQWKIILAMIRIILFTNYSNEAQDHRLLEEALGKDRKGRTKK